MITLETFDNPNIVPRTRALVPLRDLDIKYIIGESKFTYDEVIQFIQRVMNETVEQTIIDCEVWIKKFVPKRSGDLRESLLTFLKKSRLPPTLFKELRNVRIIIGVGAEVPYAKYTMKFTDAQVQHDGTWFEHSGKRAYDKDGNRVFLDDPHARGGYFQMLIIFAKEKFRMNLSKIKWVNVNGS